MTGTIVTGRCKDCGYDAIKSAICNIDRVIADIGNNKYLEDVFFLDKKVNTDLLKSLLRYRSVLEKKLFDTTYIEYSTDIIISKVKKVIYGM